MVSISLSKVIFEACQCAVVVARSASHPFARQGAQAAGGSAAPVLWVSVAEEDPL
ncbi:hypothetical protein [Micromonospora marina]|uniref:hypothetical protein n=1 Tax=Micromonospora marina TaxID=307120 RepID=UPI003D71CCBD